MNKKHLIAIVSVLAICLIVMSRVSNKLRPSLKAEPGPFPLLPTLAEFQKGAKIPDARQRRSAGSEAEKLNEEWNSMNVYRKGVSPARQDFLYRMGLGGEGPPPPPPPRDGREYSREETLEIYPFLRSPESAAKPDLIERIRDLIQCEWDYPREHKLLTANQLAHRTGNPRLLEFSSIQHERFKLLWEGRHGEPPSRITETPVASQKLVEILPNAGGMNRRKLTFIMSAISAGKNARDLRPHRNYIAHTQRLFSIGSLDLSDDQAQQLIRTPLAELVAAN